MARAARGVWEGGSEATRFMHMPLRYLRCRINLYAHATPLSAQIAEGGDAAGTRGGTRLQLVVEAAQAQLGVLRKAGQRVW